MIGSNLWKQVAVTRPRGPARSRLKGRSRREGEERRLRFSGATAVAPKTLYWRERSAPGPLSGRFAATSPHFVGRGTALLRHLRVDGLLEVGKLLAARRA